MSWYLKGVQKLLQGQIDLDGGNIKCMLVTDSYVPNTDNNEFVSDVSAYEVSDINYARQTLVNPTVTIDAVNNKVIFDANDVVFSFAGSVSFRYVIVYQDNAGNDAASPLIAVKDVGLQSVSSANVTVQWSTEGILVSTSV